MCYVQSVNTALIFFRSISLIYAFVIEYSLPLDYDRIMKNIERGEGRISRRDEIMKAIGKKLDRYKNPWLELKIQYGQNKGKLYNEECDRFMVSNIFNLESNLLFHFCILLTVLSSYA